ncbi:YfhO family protein [uncultured Pseudokineococcus sp.]|uniref:YfhO family protein n=1 Tax=uncultured Pseudokineococcus sp. TaxID=1642928 RepID=UPI0026177DCD|nr:YfhO family protein [uncultured Pseudokineococcus sp.]
MTGRSRDWLIFPVAVVVAVIAHWRVLLGRGLSAVDVLGRYSPWATSSPSEVQNRLQTDIAQIAPQTIAFYDRLRAGDFPLYDPTTAGGMPWGVFPLNNNSGLLSPTQWSRLVLPDAAADSLRVLVPLVVAQVCLFYLLRRRGLSHLPAAVGAVAFALAGSLWVYDYRVVAVYLLPMLLLGADRLLGGHARSGGALLAIGTATSLLEGYPSTAAANCAVVALYAVAGARADRRGWRPVGVTALAGALGAGMAALHMLPLLEVVRNGNFLSFRSFGPDAHLPPQFLFSTFASRVTGTDVFEYYGLSDADAVAANLHVGSVVTGLAAAGLVLVVAGRAPSRMAPLWWAAVLPGGLLLTATTIGGPLLTAYYAVPVLGDSTIPASRHVVVLGMAVAAATALERARGGGRDEVSWSLRVAAAVAAFLPLSVVVPATVSLRAAVDRRPDLTEGLGVALWVHGAVLLLVAVSVLSTVVARSLARERACRRARRLTSRAALGVVLVVIVAQAVVPWHGFIAANEADAYYPVTDGHRAARTLLGSQGRLLGVDLAYMPNTNVLYGIPDVRGHAFPFGPYRRLLEEVVPPEGLERVFIQVDAEAPFRSPSVLDELAVSVVALEAGARPYLEDTPLSVVTADGLGEAEGLTARVPTGADVARLVVSSQGAGCSSSLLSLRSATGETSQVRRLRSAAEPYALYLDTLDLSDRLVRLDLSAVDTECVVHVEAAGEQQLAIATYASDSRLPLVDAHDSWLYVRESALPLVGASSRWTCVPDQDAAVATIETREREERGAVLVGRCPAGGEVDVGVDVLSARVDAGTVDAQTQSEVPHVLEVRLNAWPGWRATVDGEEAEVLSLNGAQLAVRIPAGTHDVRLEYRPTSFAAGLAISGVAGAVGLLLLVREGRRRRNGGTTRERADEAHLRWARSSA